MTPMVLCILCIVAFFQLMRCGQASGRKMEWVGASNYVVAALICAVWWVVRSDARFGWEEAAFGSSIGLGLAIGFFLINASIRLVGVGISHAVERVASVLLPVTASILIWKEIPGAWQAVGLVLALASFPMLARGDVARVSAPSHRKVVLVLTALLIITGCIGVALKAYTRLTACESNPGLFTIMFVIAAAANSGVAMRGTRPEARDLLYGFGLGIVNLLSNYFMVRAIAVLPGPVVFPTLAAGVILIGAVVSTVVWGERYRGRVLAGMAVAAIAVIVINL